MIKGRGKKHRPVRWKPCLTVSIDRNIYNVLVESKLNASMLVEELLTHYFNVSTERDQLKHQIQEKLNSTKQRRLI